MSLAIGVFVTVSADTTFRAETRVKVIVGDLERVRGRLTRQLGFRDLERRSPSGIQQRRN